MNHCFVGAGCTFNLVFAGLFLSVLMCAGLEQDGLVGEHAIHQVALKKGSFSPINDDKLAQRIPATASAPHDGASSAFICGAERHPRLCAAAEVQREPVVSSVVCRAALCGPPQPRTGYSLTPPGLDRTGGRS